MYYGGAEIAADENRADFTNTFAYTNDSGTSWNYYEDNTGLVTPPNLY